MNRKQIRVLCLPVAGREDPTQLLMIEALNSSGISAFNGIDNRFTGIFTSALKFRPDFIHFDWIESYYYRRNLLFTWINMPWFFFQIWFAKRILKIQIVWSLHNIIPHNRKHLGQIHYAQRRFAKYVHFIRLFSAESLKLAAGTLCIPENKFRIVPSGSYITYYPNTVSKAEARSFLRLPSDKKVFLFFGSVKQYKNVEALIEAFKELNDKDTLLLIAGKCYDNKLKVQIKAALSDNITFIDKFIPVAEVQYYYNSADVVVSPFVDIENSGSVLVAMGFKKVIIAPEKGVLKYRLNKQSGFLYENGNLLDTMLKFMQTPPGIIEKIGLTNFEELDAHKWEDFSLTNI